MGMYPKCKSAARFLGLSVEPMAWGTGPTLKSGPDSITVPMAHINFPSSFYEMLQRNGEKCQLDPFKQASLLWPKHPLSLKVHLDYDQLCSNTQLLSSHFTSRKLILWRAVPIYPHELGCVCSQAHTDLPHRLSCCYHPCHPLAAVAAAISNLKRLYI